MPPNSAIELKGSSFKGVIPCIFGICVTYLFCLDKVSFLSQVKENVLHVQSAAVSYPIGDLKIIANLLRSKK